MLGSSPSFIRSTVPSHIFVGLDRDEPISAMLTFPDTPGVLAHVAGIDDGNWFLPALRAAENPGSGLHRLGGRSELGRLAQYPAAFTLGRWWVQDRCELPKERADAAIRLAKEFVGRLEIDLTLVNVAAILSVGEFDFHLDFHLSHPICLEISGVKPLNRALK